MPAIGMGMLWGGYTLTLWGYCLLQGYAIGIADLVIPKHYKGKWPPEKVVDPADVKPQVAPGEHPGDAPWSYPHGGGPIA